MLSVSAAARDSGSKLAVIAGERRLTFEQLYREVQPLAETLSQLAPSANTPVAFVAHPNFESLLLVYALLELQTPALPMNPRLLASDHKAMVEHAGAVQVTFHNGVLSVAGQARSVGTSDCFGTSALIATSGSTGRAKIVKLSKPALIAAADASADRLGWKLDDRWLLSLSLCHIGGYSIATRCLLARLPVVLGQPRGDATELARLIHAFDVTIASLVSTQLHRVLVGQHDLKRTKLRTLLLGGMNADPWLVAAARTEGIPVLCTYGMTETASQVATQLPSDLRSLIGPCHDVGPALAKVEIKILNDEILVRGPMLFDGYVGEELEVDSMRGPLTVGLRIRGGWFHTGDWGRLDANGRLTVLGRSADRIVTGGENVAPAEVEFVLETLPAIERACVFGVPEAVKGEQVAAAIILRPGFEFDEAELEAQLADRLASFKRPHAWAILGEFATTATGKLDRSATARIAEPQLRIAGYRKGA